MDYLELDHHRQLYEYYTPKKTHQYCKKHSPLRHKYLSGNQIDEIQKWRESVIKKVKSKQDDLVYSPVQQPKRDNSARAKSANVKAHKEAPLAGPRSMTFIYGDTDVDSMTNKLSDTSIHYIEERKNISRRNNVNMNQFLHNTKVIVGDPQDEVQDDQKQSIKQWVNSIPEEDENAIETVDVQISQEVMDEVMRDVQRQISEDISSQSEMGSDEAIVAVNAKTPIIALKSASNDLLNVTTIDDCRITCRRRPNRIVSSADMLMPNRARFDVSANLNEERKTSDRSVSKSGRSFSNLSYRVSNNIAHSGRGIRTAPAEESHEEKKENAFRRLMNHKTITMIERDGLIKSKRVVRTPEQKKPSKKFRKLNNTLHGFIDELVRFQGNTALQKYRDYEDGTHNEDDDYAEER